MSEGALTDRHAGQDEPLVSAIITTHDREPDMVLRAVNSVLNQTYPNLELIVVDDSAPSFARRAEVERSVRGASDGILYVKHEYCQGACAARNTGLSHAKGVYVGFLDDDDEWLPTKIEAQVKGFVNDEIALVYGRILFVDGKNGREHIGRNQGESGYIFEKLLRNNIIGPTSNSLIKRECIEAVGRFDVQMESCQDYDLWLRLALRYPVQFIDVPLTRYYAHQGKRITTDDEKKINGVERIFTKYASCFNNDNEAWYMWYTTLIPHYLRRYGRKKAFDLWVTCVKKRPGQIFGNFKLLARIILGDDLYMAIRRRLADIYHRLK